MLVHDKVEIKEGLFNIIVDGLLPYSEVETDLSITEYYIIYGSKVVKVKWLDQNLTQYFIYSNSPV